MKITRTEENVVVLYAPIEECLAYVQAHRNREDIYILGWGSDYFCYQDLTPEKG